MKYIFLFLILALLVWGFTGLNAKETIVITTLGFSLGIVSTAFFAVMAVTLLMAAIFVTQEVPTYVLALGTQIIPFFLWHVIFSIVPDAKMFTIFGVNIWNMGIYIMYGVTVLIAVYATSIAFSRRA